MAAFAAAPPLPIPIDLPDERVQPTRTNDYAELRRIIASEGLLTPQDNYYWLKGVITAIGIAIGVGIAVTQTNIPLLIADAVFLGFMSTQVALLAHDVGHHQAWRGTRASKIAHFIFGPLLLAVSGSWWVDKHNKHHAAPNHVEDDPDLHLPFLAFAPDNDGPAQPWFKGPLFRGQVFWFLFLLPWQALNMRVSSVRHLITSRDSGRLTEAVGIALNLGLYGALLFTFDTWWLAIAFLAVHQGTFGIYNSMVFATNHKGMPLLNESVRLDFFREQVVTARDVHGSWFTDFWHGGLNYQIEHHLFPTMPRNNLAKAKPIVRAFCKDRGVSHHSTGIVSSYREAFATLRWVSW
jgi:fatty acid desaturase